MKKIAIKLECVEIAFNNFFKLIYMEIGLHNNIISYSP